MQPSRWRFSPTLLFSPIPLHAVVPRLHCDAKADVQVRFGLRSKNYEYADTIRTRHYQLKVTTLTSLLDLKREVVAMHPHQGPSEVSRRSFRPHKVSFSWRIMMTMNLTQPPHKVFKDEHISLLLPRGLV